MCNHFHPRFVDMCLAEIKFKATGGRAPISIQCEYLHRFVLKGHYQVLLTSVLKHDHVLDQINKLGYLLVRNEASRLLNLHLLNLPYLLACDKGALTGVHHAMRGQTVHLRFREGLPEEIFFLEQGKELCERKLLVKVRVLELAADVIDYLLRNVHHK